MNTRKLHFETLENRYLLALLMDVDFSDGVPTNWTLETERYGEIKVVDGALRAESSRDGYSGRTHAIFPVPDSVDKLILTFDHIDQNDEDTTSDAVFARIGSGNWERILPYHGTGKHEVEITGYTEIDLRWYDNYTWGYDGREWDNVQIVSLEPPPPPTPQLVSVSNPVEFTFDTRLPGPDEGWEYHSTNEGRIQVVNGQLRMDDSRNGNQYSLNEAILHVDLQGQDDVYLSGTHREWSDETHDQDGVFISTDGVTWERVSLDESSFTILLDPATVAIKFAQYDNYGVTSDGRAWDNIKVEVIDFSQPLPYWPEGLGVAADLWIDSGVALSHGGSRAAANSLGWTYDMLSTDSSSYQNSVIGGNADDLNGVLLFPDGRPRYWTIFINGGHSTSHYNSMNQKTRDRYNEFVAAGGSTTGSCAGLYFQAPYYVGTLPLNVGQSGYGSVNHSASFAGDDQNHPFVKLLKQYNNGSTLVTNIPHRGGPYLNPNNTTDPRMEFFGKISGAGLRLGGSPYYVAWKESPTTGRVTGQPSHPEFATSGGKLALQKAQLVYAAMGAYLTPDIEATLSAGTTISMVGPTQKIGDGQYHLYDVPVINNSVNITLTGATENVDLYFQCGGLANEKSYIASSTNVGTSNEQIQISGLTDSTCSLAVYGNHTILNGAAYSLTVG